MDSTARDTSTTASSSAWGRGPTGDIATVGADIASAVAAEDTITVAPTATDKAFPRLVDRAAVAERKSVAAERSHAAAMAARAVQPPRLAARPVDTTRRLLVAVVEYKAAELRVAAVVAEQWHEAEAQLKVVAHMAAVEDHMVVAAVAAVAADPTAVVAVVVIANQTRAAQSSG